jgi:hypothetical protein
MTLLNSVQARAYSCDAPVFDVVRRFAAVFTAQFRQIGTALSVAVLHPIGGFPHIAVAAIHTDIRLGVQPATILHEFIGAELIIDNRIPCQLVVRGALRRRANCVHPAVTGGEIAAGETQIWTFHPQQGFKYVGAEPVFISIGRFRVVNPAVDQIFQVAAENIMVDIADCTFKVYFHMVHQKTPL